MNVHSAVPQPKETMRFETERELIGTLLSMKSPTAVKAAAAIVSESDFSEPMFARMFWMLRKCADAEQGGPILVSRMLQELRPDEDTLAAIGWTPAKLIGNCVSHAMPGIALEATARSVRYDALNMLLNLATDEGDLEQVQKLSAEMEALQRAQYSTPTSFTPIGTVVDDILQELSVAYQSDTPTKDYAAAGIGALASMIGGWRRGRYYVVAGRPGMGKTTVALSSLIRTAQAGHGVLYFSLEMGKDELTEMALCDLAWTKTRRVEYRDISANAVHRSGFAEKYSEIQQVAPLFRSLPFLINDKGGLTIADVRSQALDYSQRLAAQGKRLDVIAIDHMGLLKPTGNYRGNKVAETEEVSAALKQLAKELGCAVVALCQLSRQTEGREDKRPTLSDLRWSGGIEQDADCVMMAYREEYYLRKEETDSDKEVTRLAKLAKCKNTMSLFIEKQRGGPTGEVKLFCDIACGVVRSLDGGWHG